MHVQELLSLKGKIILVTGGAGKFGRHIATALAEAGGTVILASRTLKACKAVADTLIAEGHTACAMPLDQADPQSVSALKAAIAERFGRLDVFVNNAYALTMLGYDDPLEAWEKSMAVNATGMFNLTREMIRLMEQGGGGSVIHIGSMKGSFSPSFDLYEGTTMDASPDYSFHKGGLVAFTKYLARRFGPKHIRVNCISPGGLAANQPEPFTSRYCKAVPLGRMANDDDIKGLVVLLASDASAYLTGVDILMDGGLHC
jgi:NAD(P)-dependent dehydrogenase (short-subunit alcohol dehydrogenase family)